VVAVNCFVKVIRIGHSGLMYTKSDASSPRIVELEIFCRDRGMVDILVAFEKLFQRT
jgi:hypothetical protein